MHILATIFCFKPYLVAKSLKKQKKQNKNKVSEIKMGRQFIVQ